MKKSLFLASVAVMSASFANSATSAISEGINVIPQQIAGVNKFEANTVYMGMASQSLDSRQMKGINKMPKYTSVKYMRPRGSLFSNFTNQGTIIYYAPSIFVPPFKTIKYQSVGIGSNDNCMWSIPRYSEETNSEASYPAKGIFAECEYGIEADNVPKLTVGSSSYNLKGYYKEVGSIATKEFSAFVSSVPNFTDYVESEYGTVYSTPAYIAPQTRQRDEEDGSYMYPYTTIAITGSNGKPTGEYWLGNNSKGINCVGLGLEKPDSPYIIKSACMVFMNAYVTKDTPLKATIYKVESFDGDSVKTVLGDAIAEGTTTLRAQGIASKPSEGILTFKFHAIGKTETITPEINDNTVILITGYDASTVKSITIPLLSDSENECYIPAGYTGSVDSKGSVDKQTLTSLWGFFSSGNGDNQKTMPCYNAPAIFVEAEYPWMSFIKDNEPNYRQFDFGGETYGLQLFSYKPSTEWTIKTSDGEEIPDWIKLYIDDIETEDNIYNWQTVAAIKVEPLPAGVNGRSCHIVFSYPGASQDYYVLQGETGVQGVTVNGTKVVSTNGNFEVSYPSDVTSMKVYNLAGQMVKSVELNTNGFATVDAQDLAHGMYIVKFNNNFTTKVVK